jgi:glycosyltransferase involved in cell wall biosynthesis
VVPSLNSTESFGRVQIEAMLNGVPVVASHLPGVRQPVTMTGMGRVVPVGDAASLATAIVSLLRDGPPPAKLEGGELEATFSSDRAAAAYASLFSKLLAKRAGGEP